MIKCYRSFLLIFIARLVSIIRLLKLGYQAELFFQQSSMSLFAIAEHASGLSDDTLQLMVSGVRTKSYRMDQIVVADENLTKDVPPQTIVQKLLDTTHLKSTFGKLQSALVVRL